MSWLSNTLGSIAGSVLGSAVQNHYNSANAAQANAWNVENYKHRYQWAVEDMRQAGLNPILAATNGIGGSISGASAASVGMSDIGSTMNSARAASAAERQAKNAENLAVSQIEKNVAEADSTRQSTHGTVLQNGILANDLNLREQTYEKRLGYELEKMDLELENRTFFVLTEKIRQKKNFFDILTQDIGVWHGTEKNSRRAFRKRAFARRI